MCPISVVQGHGGHPPFPTLSFVSFVSFVSFAILSSCNLLILTIIQPDPHSATHSVICCTAPFIFLQLSFFATKQSLGNQGKETGKALIRSRRASSQSNQKNNLCQSGKPEQRKQFVSISSCEAAAKKKAPSLTVVSCSGLE